MGSGPTGIYSLFRLLEGNTPLSIAIYEQAEEAGVGMPYNDNENSRLMLANIASIEIPPILSTYLEWLQGHDEVFLGRYEVDRSTLHDRQFLPRILLGKYFRDQFLLLVEAARMRGFPVEVNETSEVTDLEATNEGPASAFELFGFKVFESGKADDSDEVIGDPQAYSVDFSLSGENDGIEKKLKGRSTLWKDREKPASGAAGLMAKARGDYRRLLAAFTAKAAMEVRSTSWSTDARQPTYRPMRS